MTAVLPMNGNGKAGAPAGVQGAGDYRELVETLGKRVSLVKVRVTRWRGEVALRKPTVLVDGKDVSTEVCNRPHVAALPPGSEWPRRFALVEGRLRRLPERLCYGGVRVKSYTPVKAADGSVSYEEHSESDEMVIPRESVPGLRADFAQIVTEQWDPLVAEFLAAWPALLAGLESDPAHWALIRDHLPASVDALAATFGARLRELPLGLSVDDLTVEALQRGAGDYLEALRQSIFRQSSEKLKEACAYLLERISEKGKIQKSTIDNVTSAVAMFRGFSDVMGAQEVLPLLEQAERLLQGATTTEIYQSAQLQAGLAQDVSKVLDRVVGSIDAGEMLARRGRQQRKVAL